MPLDVMTKKALQMPFQQGLNFNCHSFIHRLNDRYGARHPFFLHLVERLNTISSTANDSTDLNKRSEILLKMVESYATLDVTISNEIDPYAHKEAITTKPAVNW